MVKYRLVSFRIYSARSAGSIPRVVRRMGEFKTPWIANSFKLIHHARTAIHPCHSSRIVNPRSLSGNVACLLAHVLSEMLNRRRLSKLWRAEARPGSSPCLARRDPHRSRHLESRRELNRNKMRFGSGKRLPHRVAVAQKNRRHKAFFGDCLFGMRAGLPFGLDLLQ